MEDIIRYWPCCIILLLGGIALWFALAIGRRADESTGSLEEQRPEWRE